MNVKLIGDKILVEVVVDEAKTASGLIVAKSAEPTDIRIGVAVAVGPGQLEGGVYQTPTVKVGDKILFQYGTKVSVEGKDYMLVGEAGDVLMVLEPSK